MGESLKLLYMLSVLQSFLGLSLHMLSNPRIHAGGHYEYFVGQGEQPLEMVVSSHVFLHPDFWAKFAHEVQVKKSWKCSFPQNILMNNLDQDIVLYNDSNKSFFLKRRLAAAKWAMNDFDWMKIILGACKELASGSKSIYSQQLEDLRLLEALQDFVDHIDYFYKVAGVMDSRGEEVLTLRKSSLSIHDIDKLDPVMLVAYSERFEDNVTSSLWDACVGSHTLNNPHHQQACIWQSNDTCDGSSTCMEYVDARTLALREMVCDKVSRRIQKNLNGQFTKEMWDVDLAFFKGLPLPWLEGATNMMQRLKHWKPVP